MSRLIWLALGPVLMACGTPGYGPETSYVEVTRIGVSASQTEQGEKFRIVFGPKESRQAAREAANQTKGLSIEEFRKAWQETSRRLAEQELRRLGFCASRVEMVTEVRGIDKSRDTLFVVRCVS